MTTQDELTDALTYLAAVVTGIGGPQSSVAIVASAKERVGYLMCKLIDERIEAATGASP